MPPFSKLSLLNQTPKELVVLVHGTRDIEGQQQIRLWVQQLAQNLGAKLRLAWLECLSPTLDDVLLDCAVKKRQVILLPLLLYRAGHAKIDIPQAIEKIQQHYPDFIVHQTSVVGQSEPIVECWKQAIQELNPVSDRLCFFGRGARDPEALLASQKVIDAIRQIWKGDLVCAYAGLQAPSLPEALAAKPFSGGRQLFIPCLLFKGLLLDKAIAASEQPQHWLPVLCEIDSFTQSVAILWEKELQTIQSANQLVSP
jgi:sirohydrochlorin ferrochelatase